MRGGRTLLFRRSSHLVCYWREGDLVVHNYATGRRVWAHPLTCQILDFFDEWRSAEELFAAKPSLPRAALEKFLRLLTRYSLLQRADRPVPLQERLMEAWKEWNPVAGFFHTSTKDVPFSDVETSTRFLRARAKSSPIPSPVKRYPNADTVSLPPPRVDGEFARVVLARRTWRKFSRRPLDRSSLSTLLRLTAGVQRWVTTRSEGRIPLKTAPSGGARHPIELYVLTLRVDGLARGLYHYAADDHVLELIKGGATARQVDQYLPTQWWYRPASVLVFFTAAFPRCLWRYPYARAYRAVLIEAGHVCQTFCFVATWLGLAPFCSMALADSRIEADLQIDGVTESVLYAAGVGTRPPGVDWAPWPTKSRSGASSKRSARRVNR